MNAIILQPKTPDEVRLIKQLAKTLNIKASIVKETPEEKKKRAFLESLDRSIEEVKAHLRGEIELKSMDDFLNEL